MLRNKEKGQEEADQLLRQKISHNQKKKKNIGTYMCAIL